MTTRAEQFAAQFEAVNDAIVAAIIGCTDKQWRHPCASEGWSVAVVAHHIAVVQPAFARILEALAAGETVSPRSSMEAVHRGNAQHAHDYATVGATETLDELRTNGAVLVRHLRGLRDAQLERTAGRFGERELSVAQVVEWVVIGHSQVHLESIRATLAV